MLFDLGIFKKKNILKFYKILIGFCMITGVTLLLLNRFGPKALHDPFVAGIGAGLVFAIAPFAFYYYKKKSKGLEDEIEVQFTDERLVHMKQKVMAIAGVLAIAVSFVLIIASRYIDLSFTVGGSIIIYTYCISLIFLKLIYKDK